MNFNNFEKGVVRPDPVPLLNEMIARRPGNVRNRAAIRGLSYTLPGSLLDDLAIEIELLRAAVTAATDALPGDFVMLADVHSATSLPTVESYASVVDTDVVLFQAPDLPLPGRQTK